MNHVRLSEVFSRDSYCALNLSAIMLATLVLVACGDDNAPNRFDSGVDSGMADARVREMRESGTKCSDTFIENTGCKYPNFTSATDTTVEIKFDANTNTYSPKCLLFAYYGKVRFSGDFVTNPIREAYATYKSTIPNTDQGNTLSVDVDLALEPPIEGNYGFYSATHGASDGTGMAGMIKVIYLE